MSSPASVGDTGVRVEVLGLVDLGLGDELLELGDLSNFLESEHFILLVTIDSETCRVISTVLETRKTWYGAGESVTTCHKKRGRGLLVLVSGGDLTNLEFCKAVME